MLTKLLDRTAQLLATAWRYRPRYRTILLFQLTVFLFALTVTLFTSPSHDELVKHDLRDLISGNGYTGKTFGGYDSRPQSNKCYKQERVATLFAVFLGVFGADHWYARHWVLAIFKLLTGGGLAIWAAIDVALWIVGGFYGTPGCGGGCKKEWLC